MVSINIFTFLLLRMKNYYRILTFLKKLASIIRFASTFHIKYIPICKAMLETSIVKVHDHYGNILNEEMQSHMDKIITSKEGVPHGVVEALSHQSTLKIIIIT
jgi:hypothetical protein